MCFSVSLSASLSVSATVNVSVITRASASALPVTAHHTPPMHIVPGGITSQMSRLLTTGLIRR